MNYNKQTYLVAFALFSLFFGAGNLILPPFLGYNAGNSWAWVAIGFALSGVVIPILAIYGYARLQGTLLDFAKKVSSNFALLYAIIVYCICVSLPSPRTASVAYQIAIAPYFDITSLSVSVIYFTLVLLFALNRTHILSLIGKFLTPLIILILLLIITLGFFADLAPMGSTIFENTFTNGILEGYQTFDALGGVVVGGVIVISLTLQGKYNYQEKKRMIARSGLLAGIGLFVIYSGLIALGAYYSGDLQVTERTELLKILSKNTLGGYGTAFLGVLVALACFTTAVGIVTGTADFVKGIAKNTPWAYTVTSSLGCLIGVLVGQFDVGFIINIALPALMFIYPITIVLIILNSIPTKLASAIVFRAVTLITFVFSIPDFLQSFLTQGSLDGIKKWIPFADQGMGWILPGLLVFIGVNIFEYYKKEAPIGG